MSMVLTKFSIPRLGFKIYIPENPLFQGKGKPQIQLSEKGMSELGFTDFQGFHTKKDLF